MIQFTFSKALVLIKEVHQISVLFVTAVIFLGKGFKFQHIVSNGCHDVLMVSINISSIPILKIHDVRYCCIIADIIKGEAMNLFKHVNLTEKNETL